MEGVLGVCRVVLCFGMGGVCVVGSVGGGVWVFCVSGRGCGVVLVGLCSGLLVYFWVLGGGDRQCPVSLCTCVV